MRSKILYVITLLLLTTTALYPQRHGATPLAESAMEHLYPRPARWSGAKYTTPPSTLNRFYLTLGVERYGVWSYEEGKRDDLNGWMDRLGVGYTLSPVHSVEVGASWNGWDTFSRVDASYLFNVTAFANRTEQATKWELFMKLGAESYVDTFSEGVAFGASGAFRAKYNLSPSVSLYVEPKLSVVGGGDNDFSTSVKSNLFVPSATFGVSVNIGQVRNNIRAGINYRRALRSTYEYIDKPLFAIKTNLLLDAVTAINIEAEVPIGDRWSVAGEWIFPWWTWDDGSAQSPRNRIQILQGNIMGRYWFGDRSVRPQMTGWFAGVYAGAGLYDIERNKEGVQGEFFIAGGLAGGYVHTINQSGNLRMEYSLGVGYLQTDYRRYTSEYYGDNNWRAVRTSRGNYSWFGPTQAKVSLVWLLGRKVKKGGAR